MQLSALAKNGEEMEALCWPVPNIAPLVAILSLEGQREFYQLGDGGGLGAKQGDGEAPCSREPLGFGLTPQAPGRDLSRTKSTGTQAPPATAPDGQTRKGGRVCGQKILSLSVLDKATGNSQGICMYRDLMQTMWPPERPCSRRLQEWGRVPLWAALASLKPTLLPEMPHSSSLGGGPQCC